MRVRDDNMNLCKGRHWKKEVVVGRKRPPPPQFCLYQRRRHLEIWRCQNENSAFAVLSWRHSRGCPFRFRAITTPRSRMLEKDANFFNVISAASLWDLRLWCQWGEGMWELNIFVSTSLFTVHIITLFLLCFFSGVFARWRFRDALSKAGDFWQHYWTTGRDWLKTGDAGQSFESQWNLVLIEYSNFVQVQYNVLM